MGRLRWLDNRYARDHTTTACLLLNDIQVRSIMLRLSRLILCTLYAWITQLEQPPPQRLLQLRSSPLALLRYSRIKSCAVFLRVSFKSHTSTQNHCCSRLGTLFPRSFVSQPSPSTSSDNPWKLIFSTIILIDCFILHLHVLCFLRFRHRTHFRNSFSLASMF